MSQVNGIKIAFCGDIMLGRHVPMHIGAESLRSWLKEVSPAWEGADLLIGNLETPCVEYAKPVESPLPELIFRTSIKWVGELRNAGFSALTLANNHILNCGPEGLRETIAALKKEDIPFVGAGMNIQEALEPSLIKVGDQTVALVAYCYSPEATDSTPGVAPATKSCMRKGLKLAREKADIVVAFLHDGLEYSDVPPTVVREKFKFLAKNGADIVVGHHPHVLQGIEWVGKVPIAYSLGDFIFDNVLPSVTEQNFSRMAMSLIAPEEIRRDSFKFHRSAILSVTISATRSISVTWHPIRQSPNLRPQLSIGKDKAEDLLRLEDLSNALLNPSDPRHALADSVFNAAWNESRDTLKINQLIHMAIRPKWRYIPHGLRWLKRRLIKPKLYNIQKV